MLRTRGGQTPIGELGPLEGLTSGEVERVFGTRFVLRDGTGDVLVDAGPASFRRISVSPRERLRVVGEMGAERRLAAHLTD